MKILNLTCLLLILCSCFELPGRIEDVSPIIEEAETLPEVFFSQAILSFEMPVDARKEIELNSLSGFTMEAQNLKTEHSHENSVISLMEEKIVYTLKEDYLNELVIENKSDVFSDIITISFTQGNVEKILKVNISVFVIEESSSSGGNNTGGGDLSFEDFNFGENPLRKVYQKDLLDLITKDDDTCNIQVDPTSKIEQNVQNLSIENTVISFEAETIGAWFINISVFCEGSNELVSAKIFGTANKSAQEQRFTVSRSLTINRENLESFDKELMDLINVIDPSCEIEIVERLRSNLTVSLVGTLATLKPIQNGLWSYDFSVKCKDSADALDGRISGVVLPTETSGGDSSGGGSGGGGPGENGPLNEL